MRRVKIRFWCSRKRHRGCETCLWDAIPADHVAVTTTTVRIIPWTLIDREERGW